MNVGYIGSSEISDFHITALQENDFKISAIGTTYNSKKCKLIAEKYGLGTQFCKNGWQEVLNYDLDAYLICTSVNSTLKILEKALETGKPIFVEKPMSYDLNSLKRICSHKNIDKIFVGYNRRFYETTNKLKDLCSNAKGGTIVVNIPDSSIGIESFIGNGCHMIDLLRYLIGEFEIINSIFKENYKKDDMQYFTALCKNDKWIISINAHSLLPANFSISVNSDKNVFELKPIEKLNIYEGMDIIEPSQEDPIRQYVPKLKLSLKEDCKFKPGFNLMYKNFKYFIKNEDSNYCSFNDAYKTLRYCWEFIDSEISRDFIFK